MSTSVSQNIPRVNSLRRSPMREWLRLASILLIALGVLIGPMFITAVQTDSSRLCAVILVVFVLAIVKNLLDIRFLQQQIDLANLQLAGLQASAGLRAFLQSTVDSVFRDHVANLYEIFRRDDNISQDNLVGLMQSRVQARTRLTDSCATIIVTLGLVGTIVGLIQASDSLGEVMTSVGKDSEAMMSGMKSTMGNMGTAFYTTLLGAVLGGVTLRLLAGVVDSNSDYLVSHIAELCEVYLLPSMRRAAREIHHSEHDAVADVDLRKYRME